MNDKHGGPNGFLLGLLIGGAAGALVSSKRGRKILKDLADYGLEYVGNTINFDDIETILNGEEEVINEEGFSEQPTRRAQAQHQTVTEERQETETILTQPVEQPKKRRLFRGIGKK